jgi:hypothetical protein
MSKLSRPMKISQVRFRKAYQTWAKGYVYYIEIRWKVPKWIHWRRSYWIRYDFRIYKIEVVP